MFRPYGAMVWSMVGKNGETLCAVADFEETRFSGQDVGYPWMATLGTLRPMGRAKWAIRGKE